MIYIDQKLRDKYQMPILSSNTLTIYTIDTTQPHYTSRLGELSDINRYPNNIQQSEYLISVDLALKYISRHGSRTALSTNTLVASGYSNGL